MSIEAMKQALEALEWIERVNAMDYEYRQKAREPITALRQAIEQAKSKFAADCDSPSWCNQYGKCHRSVIGAPMLVNCIQGQEPVAVLMDGELFTMAEYEVIAEQGDGAQPLYTAPPQREWQGLTEDEVSAAVDDCDVYFDDEFLVDFARRIEAKLKEKNHD